MIDDQIIQRGLQARTAALQSVKGIVNARESQLRLNTTVRLRWAAVLGQLLAVTTVYGVYGFELPLPTLLILIAMSAWLNVYLSIRYPPRYRLGTPFAFGLLLFDLLQLSVLLYLTGGLENPFVILLVAPVVVSAATLPVPHTFLLGALTIGIASFLVSHHDPLPWYPGIRFDLGLVYKLGIFAALMSTMVFLSFYTWRLNNEARQMSAALAATDMVLASEQRLHALDGLAAAAAHELGTPLSTIVLVAKELEYELGANSPHKADLQLLHSQAKRCREILQKLTRKPEEQDPMHGTITVRELLDESSEPYRLSGTRLIISAMAFPDATDEGRSEPVGHRRPGVIFGIGNILENAVGFAQSEVLMTARWNAKDVVITITDDGPGFAPELMDSIGEPYISTRKLDERGKGKRAAGGLGLGFFIAKTLLERSGASVNFTNQLAPRTGAVVQMAWPRSKFEVSDTDFAWPGRRTASAPAVQSGGV